jgi:hypothetical protein
VRLKADLIMDWLLSPIDPSRAHDISVSISWHARTMVAAWSFLIPLGILSARFFKVMPRQKWPEELDNKVWWRSHLIFQYFGGLMIIFAIWLVWDESGSYGNSFWHKWLGWLTIGLCSTQYVAGWLRGTKGGPSEVARTGAICGDHFDMTLRRNIFEYFHKTVGYLCLLIALVTTFIGLWLVNGPRWMWVIIIAWWIIVFIAFVLLQRAGRAYDTYQAIWGDDPELPGNKVRSNGWGIRGQKSSK